MANTDNGGGPEWDDMIEVIMDSIPVKLSNSEWKSVRHTIHNSIWDYVGDIFTRSSIEFHKTREGNSEVRLWMSIGQDCVDFQKGFDLPPVGPAVITRVRRFDIRACSPAQARRA